MKRPQGPATGPRWSAGAMLNALGEPHEHEHQDADDQDVDDGAAAVRARLKAVRLQWKDGKSSEIPGSEFELPADLVLLAMGFVSPVQSLLDEFGVQKDARGNAQAATDGAGCYATSVKKVFAAGDMRRGQSLVVWAIREGRQCARAVDEFLMGFSELPR